MVVTVTETRAYSFSIIQVQYTIRDRQKQLVFFMRGNYFPWTRKLLCGVVQNQKQLKRPQVVLPNMEYNHSFQIWPIRNKNTNCLYAGLPQISSGFSASVLSLMLLERSLLYFLGLIQISFSKIATSPSQSLIKMPRLLGQTLHSFSVNNTFSIDNCFEVA